MKNFMTYFRHDEECEFYTATKNCYPVNLSNIPKKKDMIEWITENCQGPIFYSHHLNPDSIWFRKSADAMAVKLRWYDAII